jgi:hypothetical protein
MMAARLRRFVLLLAALSGISTACRKPRGWSLMPATPISLTLSALGDHVDLRVSIQLPPNYQREPGDIASDATWDTPEHRQNKDRSPLDRSPLLSLSIENEVLSNGCSLRNGDVPDTLSVQQIRSDLLVSRCGSKATGTVDSVRAFYTMKLPETQRTISLWCTITFFGEYENHDLDDATSICSSIRWHVLETQPPPGSDNSSSDTAGKPSQ